MTNLNGKCLTEPPTNWNLFYFIIRSILLPVTLPMICYNVYKRLKERKYKNCLPAKVVVITGASSGLGEALAHVFYKAGCKVVLCARRKDELERVRKELMGLHSTAPTYPPVVVPVDLSELNSIPECITKIIEIHNHIDILINNGGISVRADILSTSMDVDIKVMLVNYFGSVAMTKAVLPSMIKRKEGRIVFISSVQGKFALPHRSAYSASKHALQAFSDSLRAEVADKNIKVTCVSPGYIRTALSLNALTSSGGTYGKMDETTAKGTDPEKMATQILNAVMRDENDIILAECTAKIAYWLRILCPSVYYYIMEKRALKLDSKKD